MPRLRSLAAAAAIIGHTLLAATSGPVHLPWTTDESQTSAFGAGTYGPDGPWQAVVVYVGNESSVNELHDPVFGIPVPVWPDIAGFGGNLPGVSGALAPEAGGNYSARDSPSALSANQTFGAKVVDVDAWFPIENFAGEFYYDYMSMQPKLGGSSIPVNATIFQIEQWNVTYPGYKNYTPEVGVVGLGTSGTWLSLGLSNNPILPELKSNGHIDSSSFGMHMGSVALGQAGSMVLGGYEQNRALGDVGSFGIGEESTTAFLPKVFLTDVTLGVATGGSPFKTLSDASISVYRGLGGDSAAMSKTSLFGGEKDWAVMRPDPTTAFITLPNGTCETAASYLPVTYNDTIGLYLWDTSDSQYTQIITSPAYLGFIFSDNNSQRINIKVPFALLNLNLTSPLVSQPTPYFPCKPMNNSNGYWSLGRAFLQAAFFGINYDSNTTFLAQAPGPDMSASVLRSLPSGNTTLETTSITDFLSSWNSTWTVLSTTNGGGGGNGGAGSDNGSGGGGGLSAGGKAGIAVGVIAGLGIVALAVWFLYRRRQQNREKPVPAAQEEGTKAAHEADGTTKERPQELYSQMARVEADGGHEPVEELPENTAVMEASGDVIYELPADTAKAGEHSR